MSVIDFNQGARVSGQGEQIVWMGFSLCAHDFAELSYPHPNTIPLEELGAAVFRGALSRETLEGFIRRVCKWGRYPGIAARVMADNSYDEIKDAFQDAINQLSQADADQGDALCEMNRISGLGRPSFASKHLRFLHTGICPVFDSIIHKNSTYAYDAFGYTWFARDCLEIAASLQRLGVSNPMKRTNGAWYAADVEVALYKYLKHRRACTD